MKWRWLIPVLLIGCGDDLGWDRKSDHDCPEVQDVEQDAPDLSDAGDVGGGGDVDDGDVVDVGGLEDLGLVGDAPQDVTEVVDVAVDQDADLPETSTPDQDAGPEDAEVEVTDTQDTDSVPLPPECTESSDCPADGPCVIVGCEDGKCLQDLELLDGVPCDTDGSVCTIEKCLTGKCLDAGQAYCDDQNVCTDDLCDAVQGCEQWPNLALCDDGNPCTAGDACVGGVCAAGNALTCDDGNDCTLDFCDLAVGCTVTDISDGTPCVDGFCINGYCGCKAFGCATPTFQYSGDVTAGMLGGMGGGVGPKMGCDATDVLIGLSFDFSTNTQTATKTTIVCGTVTADQNGVVATTQTTTQTSGGSGCYGWSPWVTTPIVKCPSGWAIVGITGMKAGGTLFHSVSIVCGQLDVGGTPNGAVQTLAVPDMSGNGGTPQIVNCPSGTIARYFETRAGCGQDALTLYCAKATPDCTGQPSICVE